MESPATNNELLIRLDERTAQIQKDVTELKSNYVTKSEFMPVQNITYGMVSLILLAFVGALIALVFRKKQK